MDFNEEMCEFIIISPEIEKTSNEKSNGFEIDLEKMGDKICESPKKILPSSPMKHESLNMSLPKEFTVASNPFLRMQKTESNSPPKTPLVYNEK